ncbi:MAG: VOC family virulence protein [Chloroflexota bacterium]|nr:VOC family virulence protein [Chloroflexota bacterium]
MSQPAIGLDHCVIHVTDWERSNAFYLDVMGAEVLRKGAGWVYQFGNMRLNVHGPGVVAQPVARIPVPPGGSDLCFIWPAPVAEAIEHLRQRGVEIELGPVARSGAQGEGMSVYFRDPDGSLLEFICYS